MQYLEYAGQTLLFAVAQRSFEVNGNFFSTLVPLATVEGETVNQASFPNRGLVWWMVRGVSSVMKSKPGRLLIGSVEESSVPDRTDPEKDAYQVNFDTVQVAGKRIIEILTLKSSDINKPRDIINRCTITVGHEPTPLVLVRWGDKIYGPFRSDVEDNPDLHGHYRVRLAKSSADKPVSMIEDHAIAGRKGYLRLKTNVALDGQSPKRSGDVRSCSYEFVTWSLFEEVAEKAPTIRLSTDGETLSRVAKLVMSHSKRQELLRQFNGLSAGLDVQPSESLHEDREVVDELRRGLLDSIAAIDDLANALIESGRLNDRLDRAIIVATAKAVEERASTIRAEAERQVKETRDALEAAKRELSALTTDLDGRRRRGVAELEKEIQLRREQADREFKEQWQRIERQQQELERQRNVIQENLQAVGARFKDEKDRLINDFLAIQPILESVGILNRMDVQNAVPEPARREDTPDPELLRLPPSLVRDSGRTGLLEETEFFERFQRHISECGFRYDPTDLVAFHIGIKCSDLSVVGGVSGTGKSSLPRLYAQALAGSDQQQVDRFLAVDVSPAWTNPSDLLGYLSLLDRRFHPSPSGLFTHLVWAAQEADMKKGDSGLYIVCLDEMNLAHVEHYFSGFIQVLSRASGNRELSVFDVASVVATDPMRQWARIPIGDNIRFVGTVNFDETTKVLSQRLLDRADLIGLEPRRLLDIEGKASTSAAVANGDPVRMTDVHGWVYDRPLDPKAAELLESIQESLRALGCPLTPRRHTAIARFLGSAHPDLCPQDLALDLQIAQRILPQVRGLFRREARQAFDRLIGILEKHEYPFARSVSMMETMRLSEELLDPVSWTED